MDKVWIVTQGRYSAYQIERVFTNKEAAEAFIAAKKRDAFWDNSAEAEEWELYGEYDPDFRSWYIWDKTSIGGDISVFPMPDDQWFAKPFDQVWEEDDLPTRGKWLAIFIRTKGEERALKIAAEKFAQFRARKAGIA